MLLQTLLVAAAHPAQEKEAYRKEAAVVMLFCGGCGEGENVRQWGRVWDARLGKQNAVPSFGPTKADPSIKYVHDTTRKADPIKACAYA